MNKHEPAGYLDAIIVIEPLPGTIEAMLKIAGITKSDDGKLFYKYRRIKDDAAHQAKFCTFAKGFAGALYVNFYYRNKPRPNFKERIYLQ